MTIIYVTILFKMKLISEENMLQLAIRAKTIFFFKNQCFDISDIFVRNFQSYPKTEI